MGHGTPTHNKSTFELKKPPKMAEERRKKVAIIGSGLIGKSWATLFARANYSVMMYDVLFMDNDDKGRETLDVIRGKLEELQDKELLREGQTPSSLIMAINVTADLTEAVKDAFYVQECVPEDVKLKSKVFHQLDKIIVDDSVILASSTSCIVPSEFVSDVTHREQCIVAHPVNPPVYIPVVEVLPAPFTKQSIIDGTMQLMKDIGQSPVLLQKPVNGFVVNRLQYALIMEAWRLVEDGVISPEGIDTAISEGLGLRYSFMGPFEVMHLNANGIREYCELYGDNIKRVCDTQTPARCITTGATLDTIQASMEGQIPIEDIKDRREWRDNRLACLTRHKQQMTKDEVQM